MEETGALPARATEPQAGDAPDLRAGDARGFEAGDAAGAHPPGRGRGRVVRILAARSSWVVLAALAVALFVVGSVHPPSSSAAAREAHLDSVIKCPSCEDLSLAQSDAPSAVALRHEVATWVSNGWSDQRVEDWVVAHDGPGGLLVPPASGPSATLYVVPGVLLAVGSACLAWFLWRRRQVTAGGSGERHGRGVRSSQP